MRQLINRVLVRWYSLAGFITDRARGTTPATELPEPTFVSQQRECWLSLPSQGPGGSSLFALLIIDSGSQIGTHSLLGPLARAGRHYTCRLNGPPDFTVVRLHRTRVRGVSQPTRSLPLAHWGLPPLRAGLRRFNLTRQALAPKCLLPEDRIASSGKTPCNPTSEHPTPLGLPTTAASAEAAPNSADCPLWASRMGLTYYRR